MHDPLTGALNRGAVIDHAQRCLAQGDMVLIVLDIDLFKQVNDGDPGRSRLPEGLVGAGDSHRQGRRRGIFRRLAHHLARRGGHQRHAAPITRAITVSVGLSWNREGRNCVRQWLES